MKINLLFLLFINIMIAQTDNNLYTIVSKANFSSNVTTVQNRAASLNTSNGIVSNIGTSVSSNIFNLIGGAFDSNNFRMLLMTQNSTLTSFNFNTGTLTSIPVSSSYTGTVYFDNVNFSNSNNTLYGLVRPFGTTNNSLGIFFGKLNTNTGVITTLSQNSISSVLQIAGTAIDPELMVYYYKTGPKFLGIDLYNGTIYSQPNLTYSSNDFDFANFTYNCADNTIYGIAREMTNIQSPNAPSGVFIQYFRLAKINPTTGVVTRISQTILPASKYSVNAGSTINPSANTYFFSDNSSLYGVSLTTGQVVINTPLVVANDGSVNFISNANQCAGAIATRLDGSLNVANSNLKDTFEIYPNPASSDVNIRTNENIDKLEVFDSLGRIVVVEMSNNRINVSNLQTGTYIIKITSGNVIENKRFIKN
jgi:hypothetical protein